MLLATLLATNKCVGGQMLIKIYLFGGRFFVRNEGIIIPFYDIIEMKNILLENRYTQEN